MNTLHNGNTTAAWSKYQSTTPTSVCGVSPSSCMSLEPLERSIFLACVRVLGGSSSLFRIAPCSFVALVESERMCFRYNLDRQVFAIDTRSLIITPLILDSKFYLDHVVLFVNLEEGRFPIPPPDSRRFPPLRRLRIADLTWEAMAETQ